MLIPTFQDVKCHQTSTGQGTDKLCKLYCMCFFVKAFFYHHDLKHCLIKQKPSFSKTEKPHTAEQQYFEQMASVNISPVASFFFSEKINTHDLNKSTSGKVNSHLPVMVI